MGRELVGMALVLALGGCSLASGGGSGTTRTVTVTAAPATTTSTTATSQPTPSTTASAPSSPTTAPPSLKSAFAAVRSGVVRIEVATCDTSGQGSGFIVGDRLVATVAHVVDGAQVVRVINGTRSAAGTVIGLDVDADLALVRTSVPLRGRPLSWAPRKPEVGDEVAALGYSLGEPLSFKPGTVNALDRKATIDGITRFGLLELDFAANHGNSGGPVIDTSGHVVGLVDAQTDYVNDQGARSGERQGDRLAVAASLAAPQLARWRASSRPVAMADCSNAFGPDGQPIPLSQYPQDVAQQAFQTLQIYFDSLNNGDYPTALAQLAHPVSLKAFADGVKSSHDEDFEVGDVDVDSQGRPVVWLRFTSTQRAGDGPSGRPQETCTLWSLDYHFTRMNGLWLIDRPRPHGTDPANSPC